MATKKTRRAKVRAKAAPKLRRAAKAKPKVARKRAKAAVPAPQGRKVRVRKQLSGTVAPEVAEGMRCLPGDSLSLHLEAACRAYLFSVRAPGGEPEPTAVGAVLTLDLPGGEEVLTLTKASVVFAEGHGEHGLREELLVWAKAWIAEEARLAGLAEPLGYCVIDPTGKLASAGHATEDAAYSTISRHAYADGWRVKHAAKLTPAERASTGAAAPEPAPPSSAPPPLGRCPRCKTRGPIGPCSTAHCNGERVILAEEVDRG